MSGEPIDEADPYWIHFSNLSDPIVETEPGSPTTVRASVFVDPGSLGGLTSSMTTGTLVAWIPVQSAPLTAADAPVVVDQLRNALAADVVMPYGASLTVSTLLADTIERIRTPIERAASTREPLSAATFANRSAACIHWDVSRSR